MIDKAKRDQDIKLLIWEVTASRQPAEPVFSLAVVVPITGFVPCET